jgi:DNA-binding MarR family transcriptional regulator
MLAKTRYVALSEFRSQLAQFLRFSAAAARAAGLQPLQYQLLLHLRGFPGRDWAAVGELAACLNASHQAAVALVQRCVRNRLVRKRRHARDRRRVEIHLTARGRRLVARVAAQHRDELHRLGAVLRAATAAR